MARERRPPGSPDPSCIRFDVEMRKVFRNAGDGEIGGLEARHERIALGRTSRGVPGERVWSRRHRSPDDRRPTGGGRIGRLRAFADRRTRRD
jgi:hypothetical protein